MSVELQNLSGGANLDVMVFGNTDSTRLYHPGQAAGTAAANGNGGNEHFVGPVPGNSVVVVLKAGSSDVAKKAMYQLVITSPSTAVDPQPPGRIAFAPVSPNPARDGAALRFDLPREAHVDLEVFDIGGRRVLPLSNQTWSAGRHLVQWSLLDDGGHAVPSGMYLVRFRADGYQETRRLLVTR
jgi:hypothetical protein